MPTLSKRAAAVGALAALALAIPSCAHVRRADGCTLPGAGWHEYRSAHFVIDVADAGQDPARLVGAFEELHAAVLASLVSEPVEIPGRVRVVVLPSRRDLLDITTYRNVTGVFWVSRLGEPVILLSREDVNDVPQVVAHELTHHVSFYLFPRQPRWFAEGLAQFVEGVAKVDRDGRRWAGGEPASGWGAGSAELTRAENLFQWTRSGRTDDLHLTSWILYRFLWNERGRQLAEFERRLSEGEVPADAWRAAFPEWDPATGGVRRLDGELAHHQRAGQGLRWEVKLGEVDRGFTAGLASRGDLHALLLEKKLDTTSRAFRDRLRRDTMQEVLREEPAHPLATAELAHLDGKPALPALRASTAARPEDGRAWYLLALEETDPAEREAALRRAVALWPDGAIAKSALASHLASTGRAREALPLANRAVEIAPWSADVVAALAKVAVELGKCREALLLQARALDVGDLGERSDPRALKRQLDEYRARCEASSAAR